MSDQVRYTGHGANTGGLQGHSVGADYPYMIIGVQDRLDAPTEWQVMDSRTSNRSDRFPVLPARRDRDDQAAPPRPDALLTPGPAASNEAAGTVE